MKIATEMYEFYNSEENKEKYSKSDNMVDILNLMGNLYLD
jgi:hypothetical protein